MRACLFERSAPAYSQSACAHCVCALQVSVHEEAHGKRLYTHVIAARPDCTILPAPFEWRATPAE